MSVIELHQVGKTYADVRALHQVDLSVERGEIVALLGPNGAGKSTLFELLLGLIRPSSGEISVLGGAPGGRRRSQVGAMLQRAGFPDQATVAEMVRLIGRSYPASLRVDDVLHRVGLVDQRSRTVGVLSGGERQRLLLALAIVGGPDLLLLDEPTAAMDLDGRHGFWEQARAGVGRGVTLMFATHDLAEADAVADRVVLLAKGRVVADATPTQLKQLVAGTVLTFETDAPRETIAALPGVERVQLADDQPAPSESRSQFVVWASHAEAVVVPLVSAGHQLHGLSVQEADLESAFAQLTRATSEPTSQSPTTTGVLT